METYYPMLKDALGMFLFLGIELSVLFIIISAGVSLLQKYIPDSKIQSILSGAGAKGYVWAALLGSVTPFCSCSTIPMLRGLLKAKAGFGPTLTFLFTSPLLNPIIVGLFVVTFGLKVTIIYVTIALILSIAAGVLLAQMGYERYVIPEGDMAAASCCKTTGHDASAPATAASSCGCASNTLEPAPVTPACGCGIKIEPMPALQPLQPLQTFGCCDKEEKLEQHTIAPLCACATAKPEPPISSCCGTKPQPGATSCCSSSTANESSPFATKVSLSFGEAWVQFKQVFPYLLLGVSLGAFIYGFVPSEFIAKHASGDSFFAVPIAAVIGIPLYVRAEALIPLSAVLVGKGMGLGAVMALIIGGGGASLTELILLKSMFRMPMIIAFLSVILGMAILAGYLFQYIV